MSAPGTLVLRLSVPAKGGLRAVAADVAGKVAAYVGSTAGDAVSVIAALERVASGVAPDAADAEITFEFRDVDGDLLIEARCGTRSSEVRCTLPA
jgi:hypothetical protein